MHMIDKPFESLFGFIHVLPGYYINENKLGHFLDTGGKL